MTEPNKDDYELPVFVPRSAAACGWLYDKICEPINRGLDKLSALWSKKIILDPKSFDNEKK